MLNKIRRNLLTAIHQQRRKLCPSLRSCDSGWSNLPNSIA